MHAGGLQGGLQRNAVGQFGQQAVLAMIELVPADLDAAAPDQQTLATAGELDAFYRR